MNLREELERMDGEATKHTAEFKEGLRQLVTLIDETLETKGIGLPGVYRLRGVIEEEVRRYEPGFSEREAKILADGYILGHLVAQQSMPTSRD